MYIIYLIFIILIFYYLIIFFIDVYNNYFIKFIVVSKNKNNKLKIHTEPISLTKSLEIQKNFKD